MRYLSLDLETTGLDPDTCQILQLAAVLDDTSIPLPMSPTFNALVWAPEYRGEAYALAMNHRILETLSRTTTAIQHLGRTVPVLTRASLLSHLGRWLGRFALPIVLAGKNVGGFDLQFLKRYPGFEHLILEHRHIDVGDLYLRPGDTVVPSLSECLRRGGFDPIVTHDALDDALDVCKLIRRWESTYENNMVP